MAPEAHSKVLREPPSILICRSNNCFKHSDKRLLIRTLTIKSYVAPQNTCGRSTRALGYIYLRTEKKKGNPLLCWSSMALVETEWRDSYPWDKTSSHGPPGVWMAAVGIRFVCIVMCIFHIPPPRFAPPLNVNETIIITDRVWKVKVWLMSQENAGTFRTVLKAVEKNSKNVSLKMYNISQLCNISQVYEFLKYAILIIWGVSQEQRQLWVSLSKRYKGGEIPEF